MPAAATPVSPGPGIGADFWRFFVGQSISSLGSSITRFALPLLVYRLTGSALDLGVATAVSVLPYLFFGLVIGAWADRVDRRRLMIACDVAQAGVVAVIPLLAALDRLSVGAVYAVAFVGSTVGIAFESAQFAAIPSLVSPEDLVTANGRIQASFSAATIAGPALAGVLASRIPLEVVLLVDTGSFLISAACLALVRRSFNRDAAVAETGRSILRAVAVGLRYVLGHPVLRAISAMMALVNFVSATVDAQFVLFAKERLAASDAEIGWLYSAGGAGVVVVGLAAGAIRRRLSFGAAALGALMLGGLVVVALASVRSIWLALPLMALRFGLGTFFNINTGSLRQTIVPNDLLGRVVSVAGVLAFSAIPLGALLGGWVIERVGSVAAVYAATGVVTALIALGFFLGSPLGRVERHLKAEGVRIAAGGRRP